jgi:hypothetical protein
MRWGCFILKFIQEAELIEIEACDGQVKDLKKTRLLIWQGWLHDH